MAPSQSELLDREQILAAVPEQARSRLVGFDIHARIDSTNQYLLAQARRGVQGAQLCLAEEQTAGRGRQGRTWVSPFAANLYLSLLWPIQRPATELSGLSLVSGIAAATALQHFGTTELGLKWPNDIVWQGRKLGGILLELATSTTVVSYVVVGIGVNVMMGKQQAADDIDQPWVDLTTVLASHTVSRNRLAGVLISELIRALDDFEAQGFMPFKAHWQALDTVYNRQVVLRLAQDRCIYGVARGVDGQGALLLETVHGMQRYAAGEVSLRLAP